VSDTNGCLQPVPERYTEWLFDLKGWIQTARLSATLAVNRELEPLYRQIERELTSDPATPETTRP